ncbi:MAG: chemotaxis protein CheC [Oscillospiraceae bacterium]|nr:chemotaxis protein CheC [Oscillospiraceae bacterium]
MGIRSFSDLSEMHVSVLSEIGNIGSGNASTALSSMLDRPVNMSTPEVGIANYNEAYEKLGGAETVMAGLVLTLSNDMSGMIMFLVPCEVACELINILMYTELEDYTEIDEMGFSAMSEIANIMAGAFVNAIADMTGMVIDISPPSSTVDMLGAMMSLPASYFAEIGDLFMYIKNEIEISGKKTPANILLLPDMPSLDKLMAVLGIG